MTEEIAATPGWVDERLDEIFAGLPQDPAIAAARQRYSGCLAGEKAPAAPSDNLGAEFNGCWPQLRIDLSAAGVDQATLKDVASALEALEAEIAQGS